MERKSGKKQGKRKREKIQNWYAAQQHQGGGGGEVKKLGSIPGLLPWGGGLGVAQEMGLCGGGGGGATVRS